MQYARVDHSRDNPSMSCETVLTKANFAQFCAPSFVDVYFFFSAVTVTLAIVTCKFHYRLLWKKDSFRKGNIEWSSSTSSRLKLTFYLPHANSGHPWIECNMQEWIILGIILFWAVKLTGAWLHHRPQHTTEEVSNLRCKRYRSMLANRLLVF